MIKKRNEFILFTAKLIVGLIIIFPLLYALSLSLMSRGEMMQYPPHLIPETITFDNYREALNVVPLLQFIANSFIVSISVTIAQVVTASLSAYGFSFFEFKGKKILFIAILATMMIPGEATIISNYLTVSSWGWNDSLKVLIIPFMTSAMGIFLMRQFYLTIPKELKEAATIDGCNNLEVLLKVIMPVSKPAIASLGIYVFINTWNQYLWPLLTINDPSKRTVQIGMSMLQFAEGSNYGVVLAGALLILLPSLLVFIIGQKALVEGMTAGAVKG